MILITKGIESDMKKRVVITGMGALTPIGNNVKSYWEGLISGKSGAAPITYFDTENYKTRFACELKNFDAADYLDRKELRIYDPFVQYALIATDEALVDAGLKNSGIDPFRTGVIWGSGNGGVQTFDKEMMAFAAGDGIPRFNPYFMPKMLVNMAAGVISIKYGLKGISFAPISACASANSAIIEAWRQIQWGQADLIVAGGSDAAISPSSMAGFNAAKALSTTNEAPHSASRPFDKDRDGFVMGEGAGALIMESLEHALARGAKIYAEIVGGAMTSDAYHLTSTHPEGEGAQRAMWLAINEAGMNPHQIDYINAHATSTKMGDLSELKAIKGVFGDYSPAISSTKSMTGHLLGAAGAVEAIAGILALNKNVIPATINTTELDEDSPLGLDIVLGVSRNATIETVMSNTFGFGGHNAIVLFKRYTN